MSKVTFSKTAGDFSPKELGIIPLGKIGGLRDLEEIWRNQLNYNVMYNVIPLNLESFAAVSPSFTNEDLLNLETDDVGSNEATRRLYAFQTNVWLNLNNNIPGVAGTLTRDQIDYLHGKVSGLPTTDKKCLTGLLVHFANRINAGRHVFTPLFQPVFVKLTQYDPYSLTYIYELDTKKDVYYFDEQLLTKCVGNEEITWRKDYRDNLEIKHSASGSKLPFITNVDIESQLFPFQLIYVLMDHNNADEVTFENCMSEFIHDPVVSLKHSMLLSAPSSGTSSGPFYQKYANRSHLCPPCGRFGFMLNLEQE